MACAKHINSFHGGISGTFSFSRHLIADLQVSLSLYSCAAIWFKYVGPFSTVRVSFPLEPAPCSFVLQKPSSRGPPPHSTVPGQTTSCHSGRDCCKLPWHLSLSLGHTHGAGGAGGFALLREADSWTCLGRKKSCFPQRRPQAGRGC